MKTFTLDVSYSQLSVFLPSLTDPFNGWSQQHVAQGFAWRPGSVGFRTLAEAGEHLINFTVADTRPPLSIDTVRAIEVPFEVVGEEMVEIGSISDSAQLRIARGKYALVCSFLPVTADDVYPVRIDFVRTNKTSFCILIADADLNPGKSLLTSADPA